MNPSKFYYLIFFNFISIQNLIVNPLFFSATEQGNDIVIFHDSTGTLNLIPYKYLGFNKILASIFLILMLSFSTISLILTNYLFTEKDLNI